MVKGRLGGVCTETVAVLEPHALPTTSCHYHIIHVKSGRLHRLLLPGSGFRVGAGVGAPCIERPRVQAGGCRMEGVVCRV